LPFARCGFLDQTRLETYSIWRFVEDRQRTAPLTDRHANARTTASAFRQAPENPGIVTYTVRIGVLGKNWKPTYRWDNAAKKIRVFPRRFPPDQ
jgi:hypothetical protein